MADNTTFSTRSNAKRAAEKAIGNGTALSIDYKLHARDDGRFEIVWVTAPEEAGDADSFAKGTRVQVRRGKQVQYGTIDYRVDAKYLRVFLDAAPQSSMMLRESQLTPSDARPPAPKTGKSERKPRAAPTGDRKPSKSAELDAAAARGETPVKPIMMSKANPHYQKRFDQLETWANAGNWDAVRGYEVKGINSYAKMVAAYRDRLLTAHEARQRATRLPSIKEPDVGNAKPR